MKTTLIYQEFAKIIAKLPNNSTSKKTKTEEMELLYSYVLNNPSSSGPKNAKKFIDYQILKSSQYKEIIGKTKKLFANDGAYIYLEDKIIDKDILDIFESSCQHQKELIVFKPNNVGQLDSLFARLRNSFAHGNILKYKQRYVLWNEQHKILSMLGVLSYNSLIQIINSVVDYASTKEIKC